MEAQDSSEREKSKKGRQDAAPPTSPKTSRLGVAKELVQFSLDQSVSPKTPVTHYLSLSPQPEDPPTILGWREKAYNISIRPLTTIG